MVSLSLALLLITDIKLIHGDNSKKSIFSLTLIAFLMISSLTSVNAQYLHDQTLETLAKKGKMSKGNAQIEVSDGPVFTLFADASKTLYVANEISESVSVINVTNIIG